MNLHEKNPSNPQDTKKLHGEGEMRLSSRYVADM
jgi:hypothetical protein